MPQTEGRICLEQNAARVAALIARARDDDSVRVAALASFPGLKVVVGADLDAVVARAATTR